MTRLVRLAVCFMLLTVVFLRVAPALAAENPMAVNRVYIVVDIRTWGGPLTDGEWDALVAQAKMQPLLSAVQSVAYANQNYFAMIDHAQGTWDHQAAGGGFEVAENQVAYIQGVLTARAAALGIGGSIQAMYAGVLQAEFRAAAAQLGYPAAGSTVVFMTNTSLDRMGAINENVQWYNDHYYEWYIPCTDWWC